MLVSFLPVLYPRNVAFIKILLIFPQLYEHLIPTKFILKPIIFIFPHHHSLHLAFYFLEGILSSEIICLVILCVYSLMLQSIDSINDVRARFVFRKAYDFYFASAFNQAQLYFKTSDAFFIVTL